jgi:hypothetical protein
VFAVGREPSDDLLLFWPVTLEAELYFVATIV